MSRIRGWWLLERDRRAVLIALGVLLTLGIGLRLILVLAKGPAFLGDADSFVYISAARGDLFGPAAWPVGYQAVLHALHVLRPSLTLVSVVQHGLGVATALLLFGMVRRVAPAGWALVPAGVVLLAGPQLYLEHAPVSEPLFTFFVTLSCYCALRALDSPRFGWPFAAGLIAVAALCVRSLGVLLPVIVVVWLAASTSGPLRRRLALGGIAALGAWLLLATYVTIARHEAGYVGPGLTRAGGGWNLYARVGPFADCTRFTPPPGTRGLCEQRPPDKRQPTPWYLEVGSPATKLFGSWASTRPQDDRALTAFAKAAVIHQPLDYLRTVGSDMERFWRSDAHYRLFAGESYDTLGRYLPANTFAEVIQVSGQWYKTATKPTPGVPASVRVWEEHTRLEGVPFVLLALFALVAVPLARGRRRALAILMVGVSVLLLLGPVATSCYDAQYVIPGYGPLAASGALGMASAWERMAARRARRRGVGARAERVAA